MPDLFAKPQKTANPADTEPSTADATLQIEYDTLIQQATQIQQTDPQAVEQAKQLLDSGELENTENIRQAAEDIIDFGI